jgi:methylphosphotriester-DNA--protein-cysteine methyltransferase
MDPKQYQTPGALQAIVNALRGAAGMQPQQTPGAAMQIGPGRDIQIRAAEMGMTPEEYMRAQQAQAQQPR